MKLEDFCAEEGVFSMPDASDKDYAEAMRERVKLEASGICFD